MTLKRLRSFFLCDEHHPIGPEDLHENGIKLENLSAAYDSKRPGVEDNVDPCMKKLIDKDWELNLLKSQLADAERHIRHLTSKNRSDEADDNHSMSSSLLCLSRINFECRPGELLAVVGGVGAGKTSFINSILGEVRILAGRAAAKGDFAYFSQTPFIMNASIRDNILFGHVGEPVNDQLYLRALSCCALEYDLKLLPDGDQTEVGERGITLSGGLLCVRGLWDFRFIDSHRYDLLSIPCSFQVRKHAWPWHELFITALTSPLLTMPCQLSTPMLPNIFLRRLW